MARIYVALQASVTVAAALLCTAHIAADAVFIGIVSAQAALLGLWISLGVSRWPFRVATTLAGVFWFGVAFLLRSPFNGWELVLLGLQMAFVAGVLWMAGRRSGYVLEATGRSGQGLPVPFQFRIRHLLALMLGVALVLGIMPYSEDTAIGMYLFVFLIAAGFASIPLVAIWAVFGSGEWVWRLFVATVTMFLLAVLLSYVAYLQTSSSRSAVAWFVLCTTEEVFSVLSLLALLGLGYRVTRGADSLTDAAPLHREQSE